MWNITVDKEKCNGCGECVEGCPGEVYELVDGKAMPVNLDECHGCHTCEALSAAETITIEDE
jgi:NAD-dependent dihydropyrimidine dehydrogenase PreA subunit